MDRIIDILENSGLTDDEQQSILNDLAQTHDIYMILKKRKYKNIDN